MWNEKLLHDCTPSIYHSLHLILQIVAIWLHCKSYNLTKQTFSSKDACMVTVWCMSQMLYPNKCRSISISCNLISNDHSPTHRCASAIYMKPVLHLWWNFVERERVYISIPISFIECAICLVNTVPQNNILLNHERWFNIHILLSFSI
jgi:hypothetical protein